ncbi:MAG TPA: TolC family protein [Rhizomicrobium sp.]|jgi:NodT family efflux transporter outer membrane factor (OMF) lipoprotein|nr:TolC family protein [Rhizomicrobium sp.]
MRILLRTISLGLSGLAVAACSTDPPVALKPQEMPSAFTAPITKGDKAWPSTDWWTGFSSPELTALETTAEQNNLDLAAAAARVEQARGQTGLAASALFPTLDLEADASRAGSKQPTFGGTGGSGGSHLGGSGPGHPQTIGTTGTGTTINTVGNTFGVSLNASYELDFWGLAQDNLRAAQNSARSALYAQRVVGLTVTSDVANTYLDVLALRDRIAIAKQNVEAAQRILKITEAKVTNGVSSNLDLAQQRAIVAQVESTIPALEEQEREARYALAVLEGRAPEGFDVQAQTINGIVAPPVTPDMPSALLARRPDIAEAEANLIAAHANVDAARAAFLPAIGLTGSGGFANPNIGSLFNPESLAWSVGASLLQSIFDGGAKTSQLDINKGHEVELVADYRSTVFNALSDTESSLGQVTSLASQEAFVTEQVKNAAEAFRISELQYREGVADLLAVLQTQQQLFTAQDTLVQIKLARLQAGVSLYRALGGGWTVDQDKNAPTRNDFNPLPIPL